MDEAARPYVREVAPGVFQISLDWSNAYLLVDNGVAALIDTGLQRDRPRLLRAIEAIGLRTEQVHTVLLTHAHCDHAGNAAYFAQSGACVTLHRAEARFLTRPARSYASSRNVRLRPLSAFAFLLGERLYPVERCTTLPTVVGDGTQINAPGGPLRVVACPGHTPGHVAYFRERDGLLFSGDAVLNIIPIRRKTGLSLPIRLLSDHWAEAKQSARRLAALRPTCLLAGHGRPLHHDTADRLQAWSDTL